MQELYDRIKNVANNILESNLPLIFADLDKSMKDRIEEGYETASIKPTIQLTINKESETHYRVTPSIKWERKITKADSLDCIDIDLAQPELFDADIVEEEPEKQSKNTSLPEEALPYTAPRQLESPVDVSKSDCDVENLICN